LVVREEGIMLPASNPTSGRASDTTAEAGRGRLRRRRPSGEPPPLPREHRWTRWIWVLAGVLVLGAVLALLIAATDVVDAADEAVLAWFARLRTPAFTGPAKVVDQLTSLAAVMGLRIATVVVLVLYGRFRHLVVFLATLVVTDWVVARLLFVPLPYPGVPVLVDQGVYQSPSRTVSALAITGFAMTFGGGLCAPARPVRGRCDLPLAGPRGGLPGHLPPSEWDRRHLDLGDERRAAIVQAMGDQLGLAVTEVAEWSTCWSPSSSSTPGTWATPRSTTR
jgi:hypothetical protein